MEPSDSLMLNKYGLQAIENGRDGVAETFFNEQKLQLSSL